MKLMAVFKGITPDNVGLDIFTELSQAYPSDRPNPRMYTRWTEYDSEDFHEIKRLLSEAGLSPWTNHLVERDNRKEFTLNIHRRYDDEDREHASYLVLVNHDPDRVTVELAHELQKLDGVPLIIGKRAPKKKNILAQSRFPFGTLVADHVRQVLEKGDLRGIRFEATKVYKAVGRKGYEEESWDEYPEPWWELETTVTMPAFSSSVKLISGTHGVELKPDFSTGCRIDDGLFGPAELHYRRSDIDAMDEFDIARTHEPITGRVKWTRRDRPFVVSQRFYQYCKKNNVKADWRPVRIDED
ncbi:MAG: hypothetical protein AAGI30_01635 [Planctomycetota bacterium]